MSANVPTSTTSTDATFAGLFILLFVVVIGGGLVGVWFVATHAIKFFNNYRDTNRQQMEEVNRQVKESAEFFSKLISSQERITHALERIEKHSSTQTRKITEVDNKVTTIDKIVETHNATTTEKINNVERKVETVDDKIDDVQRTITSLSKDIEFVNSRLDSVVGNNLVAMKGGEHKWSRNAN